MAIRETGGWGVSCREGLPRGDLTGWWGPLPAGLCMGLVPARENGDGHYSR